MFEYPVHILSENPLKFFWSFQIRTRFWREAGFERNVTVVSYRWNLKNQTQMRTSAKRRENGRKHKIWE